MFKSIIAVAVLGAMSMVPALASVSDTVSPAQATLNLNASVVNACSVTVGDITMSPYDVFGGDSTGDSTASVTCTKGASPSFGLASSVGLSNGTDTLTVDLTHSDLSTSTTSKAAQTVNIHADAASGQDISAGAYSGNTTVTISF